MKRSTRAFAIAAIAAAALASAGQSAEAATLCVGGKPGCFATIQAAVDAAHDGDTITVGRGTFAGGVTIDVSVDVRGAGAGETTIRGGGPVVTIGVEQAATEPTVSLTGVTITGGLNDSFPDHAVTQGGGVRIPQGAGFHGGGATVTIRDSVVTGNQVASRELLPPGFCGPFDCSFASGGGISNHGTLTLIDTRVTDNQAGSSTSRTTNASGGGIAGTGVLTMRRSVVSGNRAIAAPPVGGGVFAGGIDAGGRTTIEDSVVSGNRADVSSTLLGDFELNSAIAGGIAIQDEATIARTIVRDNVVAAAYAGGIALAVSGGIQDDGTLVLTDSTIDHNSVTASVPAASGATAIAAQGGLGVGGVASVRNSLVAGNRVTAVSSTGTATAAGGGITNFGQLTLAQTLVIANAATATGAGGSAQGGGINNVTLGGPAPQLTLVDTIVTANRLEGSPGITMHGGGLYTDFPVTLTRTVIAGNRPDQCFGC